MKIIYNENPLRTVVELDENDRKIFWLKIKVEELQDKLFEVHFHLSPDEFFDLDRARKEADPEKYIQEDNQEKVAIDKRVDSIFEYLVADLQGIHSGDCTCVPASCMKCRAESILGIDTLKPFPGKHELHYIDGAFSKNNSLAEALVYLRDHKVSREKPESWSRSTQEEYESYIPRWESEQARAYEYLKNYANARQFVIGLPMTVNQPVVEEQSKCDCVIDYERIRQNDYDNQCDW